MATSPLVVLINREGGAAKASGPKLSDLVEKAFAKAGARADVRLLAAKDISEAIEQAAMQNHRIVVAGGDGTISGAAQVLTGYDVELALLPLGTLNHFARDLNIPSNLEDAAKLAVEGTAHAVDVGELNGRRFINNASVGLYPFMVRRRDEIVKRHGLPKWLSSVPAAWAALSRFRLYDLQIDLKGSEKPVITPLLFVGNNRYSLDGGAVGSRASLNKGQLSVLVVPRGSRTSLLWFGFRLMIGRADRSTDFEELVECKEFTVSSRASSIEVALDGEICRLPLPFNFSIRSGGLQVVKPSETAENS